MTIDDFYKTVGYACQYKSLGETVNQIPIGEMTISLVRECFPRELFKTLREQGLKPKEQYPGIYYIRGWQAMPDVQILVTRQMDPKLHAALRVLSVDAREEDIRAFVEEAVKLKRPGDQNNVDAVMQVSVAANKELYKKVRRGDKAMCEALRELMKDEIESEIDEREQKARREERQKTIKNLMETTKWTAEQAMEAMKVPFEDRDKYLAGL